MTYGKATLTKVSLDFQLIAEPDESKSFQKKPNSENSGTSTLPKAFDNSTNHGKAAVKASLDFLQIAKPDKLSCQNEKIYLDKFHFCEYQNLQEQNARATPLKSESGLPTNS